ncbi:MAG: sugar transferase [Actinobacteria bacterium]|nr:sugar transferase [Actinomycetota bacterium]
MQAELLTRDAVAAERSLVERYARMANEGLERRPVNPVLRLIDLGLASVALVVLSPLLIIASVAIRLTSMGPVFYRGLRVGKGGHLFTMVKFRTLKEDAETRLGPYLGLELSRLTVGEVTTVGRWLRRTHIDEAPQLWNVLKGEMSLVGPRPVRPLFFEGLCQDVPQYWQRLVVPPGMTGLAQIRLTREETWEDKLAHDLEYIADRSVPLYLQVLGETALRVLRRLSSDEVAAGEPSPG